MSDKKKKLTYRPTFENVGQSTSNNFFFNDGLEFNTKEQTTFDIFNASICNQNMNVCTNVNDIHLFIPVASS